MKIASTWLPQAARTTLTAAPAAHLHARWSCLVCQKQKNIRSSWHLVALCERPNPSLSGHARVGERVRGPLRGGARGDTHRRSALRCPQERLGGACSWIFCQLIHTLYPRDNANLILAGHAWLGERVHGHGLQHGFASIGCENSAPRRLIFLISV